MIAFRLAFTDRKFEKAGVDTEVKRSRGTVQLQKMRAINRGGGVGWK